MHRSVGGASLMSTITPFVAHENVRIIIVIMTIGVDNLLQDFISAIPCKRLKKIDVFITNVRSVFAADQIYLNVGAVLANANP
jgi:hypothetical protein